MTDGNKPWIEPVTLNGDIVRLDPLTHEDIPKLWQIAEHESLWRWMPMAMVSLADMEKTHLEESAYHALCAALRHRTWSRIGQRLPQPRHRYPSK